MASRRAKLTEIWDSGKLQEHIWGTFDLIVIKFILMSFGALTIFPLWLFQQATPSTVILLVQPNLLYVSHVTVHITFTSWNFEISNTIF